MDDNNVTIQIYYDLEGQRRKDLVNALSGIVGWEPKYLGAPTFEYEVGNYRVTKNGTVVCPKSCTREIINQLIAKLKERGFENTYINLQPQKISIPRSTLDAASLDRLRNLISSKETILKAALGTNDLQIEISEDKISFPWFNPRGENGETEAYTKLIAALCKAASEQKRISAYEKPQDNMKYAMRLFLVRLGFVGDKHKKARKILLRDLSGNCSWKAGHAPIRRDEATSEQEVIENEK